MSNLLVSGLEVSYGQLQVLWGIDLHVEKGEIVALIGANGAGKSTFLNTCMGQVRAKAGQVTFDGKMVTNIPTHQIVRMGMAMVPEGRRIFPSLTVFENLKVSTYGCGSGQSAEPAYSDVFKLFPRLLERQNQKAGTLSGGEQQMLAVGRALMARPSLLLLDEPSLGLAPVLQDQLFEQIDLINKNGTSVLLIEQNAFLALEISNRAYVLQSGRIVGEGASKDLQKQDSIRASYLGGTVNLVAG